MTDHLENLEDEEHADLVRQTAAFRAAAACAKFASEARELRENDTLAMDRLVQETHRRQGSSVSKLGTTNEIIETFLDVVEKHGELAEHPGDAIEEGAEEVVEP